MSKTLSDISIPRWTEGVIRSAQLDDPVSPENSVQIAVNMNFDRIGAVQTRPGIAFNNGTTTITGPIKNFGTLNISSPFTYRLLAQAGATGTEIRSWDGTVTWSLARTLSTGAFTARFDQFLNYTWMVNGASGDAVQIYNGGVFVTPGAVFPGLGVTVNTTSLPKGDYIHAGFEGRVWVADKNNDIIYFTDIVQFTPPSTFDLTFPTVAGVIQNYIKNFSPQDGETITGLKRVPRALLVFKQNHIYRIYGAYSVDPYPAYNVGTYSQESIVQTKDGLYFHHSSGFYKFTYDSQPTEISRRVIDFVKAIPMTAYPNIKGVWDNFDTIEWSIGPVTAEGVTYTDCVMRYTISTQVWTIYDYKDMNISALILYDNGTTIKRYTGTTFGLNNFGTLGEGNLDYTLPVYFELIDRWRSFTPMYMDAKAMSGMMVSTENAGGTRVEYQINKETTNVWEFIDTVDENYCSLFPNMSTSDFNRFRLRLSGYQGTGTAANTGQNHVPLLFHGVEFLSLQNKGLNQN